MSKRIVIDCRSLRKVPAGVPNVLLSVINAIAAQQKDYVLYLVSNENFHPESEKRIIPSAQIIKIISPIKFTPNIAIIWYLFKLPFIVKNLAPDLFFTPIPNLPWWLPSKVKTLITVHDMVYKHFSKTMSFTNWVINLLLHDRSINRANFLWTDSEYTKNELTLLYPHRKCNKILVGCSVDKIIFHPGNLTRTEKEKLLQRFTIGEKFILFVGTLEPRKNLAFLISLMPALARKGFSLLIVGAKGWGKDDLKVLENSENHLGEKIKFSGFISTEDLVKLYYLADVYVSTALNEGFGLPQLEAMCCGCPVVAPHNSAMIEIVEGAGETVKGWDRDEWINTILKVSENRSFYISQGFQRAEHYRWDLVINDLVNYIQ